MLPGRVGVGVGRFPQRAHVPTGVTGCLGVGVHPHRGFSWFPTDLRAVRKKVTTATTVGGCCVEVVGVNLNLPCFILSSLCYGIVVGWKDKDGREGVRTTDKCRRVLASEREEGTTVAAIRWPCHDSYGLSLPLPLLLPLLLLLLLFDKVPRS
jgi:hypothetical protein